MAQNRLEALNQHAKDLIKEYDELISVYQKKHEENHPRQKELNEHIKLLKKVCNFIQLLNKNTFPPGNRTAESMSKLRDRLTKMDLNNPADLSRRLGKCDVLINSLGGAQTQKNPFEQDISHTQNILLNHKNELNNINQELTKLDQLKKKYETELSQYKAATTKNIMDYSQKNQIKDSDKQSDDIFDKSRIKLIIEKDSNPPTSIGQKEFEDFLNFTKKLNENTYGLLSNYNKDIQQILTKLASQQETEVQEGLRLYKELLDFLRNLAKLTLKYSKDLRTLFANTEGASASAGIKEIFDLVEKNQKWVPDLYQSNQKNSKTDLEQKIYFLFQLSEYHSDFKTKVENAFNCLLIPPSIYIPWNQVSNANLMRQESFHNSSKKLHEQYIKMHQVKLLELYSQLQQTLFHPTYWNKKNGKGVFPEIVTLRELFQKTQLDAYDEELHKKIIKLFNECVFFAKESLSKHLQSQSSISSSISSLFSSSSLNPTVQTLLTQLKTVGELDSKALDLGVHNTFIEEFTGKKVEQENSRISNATSILSVETLKQKEMEQTTTKKKF